MNKFTKLLVLVGISVALVGCESDDLAREKLKTPSIREIGTFDDCEVKYVDRGYETLSFYIAKCANTNTTTNAYNEKQGKATVFRRHVVITKEMEAEKEAALFKENALNKLTPEERKMLGL